MKLFLWSTTAFAIASTGLRRLQQPDDADFLPRHSGIVAGPLIPLSQSLLLSNYPPAKRSIALALWSMTVIVAPICGPIAGGYISDNYHWGWIFFINVPIGVAVVLMTLQTLRNRETKTEQRRIDGVGLALLIIGIGSLQVMLDRGKELDWFSSNEIIILTIVAVVAISFLIVWELTDDNPIVDLSLFKSRNFTIGCLCISLAYALLRRHRAAAAAVAGGIRLHRDWAGGVGAGGVIRSFCRRLSAASRISSTCGGWSPSALLCTRSASTGALDLRTGDGLWRLGVATVYRGLRGGLLLHAVDHHHPLRPAAGAAGGGVEPVELHPYPCRLHRDLDHHHPVDQPRGAASCAAHRIGDPFNPTRADIRSAAGHGNDAAAGVRLDSAADNQPGLIISANEIFWISAAIFILLLGLVWFARPPFSAGGGGGAH